MIIAKLLAYLKHRNMTSKYDCFEGEKIYMALRHISK